SARRALAERCSPQGCGGLASPGRRKIEKTMSDVVVITGASGGIGRATARRFAQDGAKIALLARGHAGLDATAREVEERGGKALVLPTDVADAVQVEAAAQATENALGPIDGWTNDAMTTVYG